MNEINWSLELSHTWPLLDPDPSTRMHSTAVPMSANADAVRLGVDRAGGRHLLVPLGDELVATDTADGVVTVRVHTYHFGGAPTTYLDIACDSTDLVHLFDEVLAEVLETIASESRPAAAAVRVVDQWRDLLRKHRSTLLTTPEQMSLIAELIVLQEVSQGRNPRVDWWRGPLREPHDIVAPKFAIEVKALGATSKAVQIHGIRQLEPPGKPLALVLVDVAEDEGGRTLPQVVEDVLNRSSDRGGMRRLLNIAGYSRAVLELYVTRFHVSRVSLVEVTDEVPRIVPATFGRAGTPPALIGLSYSLDLAAIRAMVRVGIDELRTWVDETS